MALGKSLEHHEPWMEVQLGGFCVILIVSWAAMALGYLILTVATMAAAAAAHLVAARLTAAHWLTDVALRVEVCTVYVAAFVSGSNIQPANRNK